MAGRVAPGWVWPALAGAVALGALGVQMFVPSPSPAQRAAPTPVAAAAGIGAGAGGAASAAVAAPAVAAAPARAELPPVPVLSAVVTVDGVPRLALVTTDVARLVRVGDLLHGGAAVLAVEERALLIRTSGVVMRLALAGPVVALSSAAAGSAASAAALPPPGYGAMPLPPQPDPRAGSGNEAFRSAVEEKARSLRK